jgi:hypothetical protein
MRRTRLTSQWWSGTTQTPRALWTSTSTAPGQDAERAHTLQQFAMTVSPAPDRWWITRSDGLRLIYLARELFSAEDLAAVAALSVLSRFPEATVELLTRCRFPPKGKASGAFPGAPAGVSELRRLAGSYSVEDAEYTQWLSSRGFAVGCRYPHDRCPANPHPRAQGNVEPVVVHEDHVFCFICAADGVCHGSKTPGYFPTAKLCGRYEQSLFALCVDKFTHWEHAKHVVCKLVQQDTLARVVYRAALKRHHGTDPRVPLAFSAGHNLVRYDGHWGDEHGRPVVFRSPIPAQLAELPAACGVDQGDVRSSPKAVEWLMHTGDVSRYGYPAVVPLWGVQMTMRLEPVDSRVFVVLHAPELRAESARERRPRYVPASRRLNEEEAWAAVEEVFPGVCRNFVRLLLAAKGCAEAGVGVPPMVFVSGPTGAGKTATVKLAAAIAGDHATEIPYSSNTDRLRAGLLSAKKKGAYASFDEFLKGARKEGKDPATAMEALLNFTPDSESHMLYIGPVPLGALPVCLWCDTSVPKEVLEHAQLARRLSWVQLHSQVEWQKTLRAGGILAPEHLRTRGTRRIVDAANSILSHVIDRFFHTEAPVFRDVTEELGFSMMEGCDIAKEKELAVRELVQLLLSAPKLAGDDARRWPGPGWKMVDLNRDGAGIVAAWKLLADAKCQTDSRVIDESDLAKVLCLKEPVRLARRSHGAKLVMRLESIMTYLGHPRINEELFDAAVELEPGDTGDDGPGDAELSQPEEGWGEGLPAAFQHPLVVCDLPAGPNDGGVGP